MKLKQQLAGIIAAPGALAAIGMSLIGIYPYVDCARFQTAAGQCTKQLEAGVNLTIAALGTLLSSRLAYEQGYGTLNPALRHEGPAGAPQGIDRPEVPTWQTVELDELTLTELRELARVLGNNSLASNGTRADLTAFVSGTPKRLTEQPKV